MQTLRCSCYTRFASGQVQAIWIETYGTFKDFKQEITITRKLLGKNLLRFNRALDQNNSHYSKTVSLAEDGLTSEKNTRGLRKSYSWDYLRKKVNFLCTTIVSQYFKSTMERKRLIAHQCNHSSSSLGFTPAGIWGFESSLNVWAKKCS